MAELADLGLVKTASAQVRVHGGSAMFKLYILNRAEAVFGFYPIAEHAVTLHGEPVPMYDVMGKDATMFHYERGDDPASIGGQYVDQAQVWFDSMWATVSTLNYAALRRTRSAAPTLDPAATHLEIGAYRGRREGTRHGGIENYDVLMSDPLTPVMPHPRARPVGSARPRS